MYGTRRLKRRGGETKTSESQRIRLRIASRSLYLYSICIKLNIFDNTCDTSVFLGPHLCVCLGDGGEVLADLLHGRQQTQRLLVAYITTRDTHTMRGTSTSDSHTHTHLPHTCISVRITNTAHLTWVSRFLEDPTIPTHFHERPFPTSAHAFSDISLAMPTP